ncbi:MBL fold hydrolase [Streptomyces sulfonofaciens]|uniref:MBL fold hydrolase n=1 Tax=Streptomyces sulfonofaciens TaxID=68272 RepID=A0A919L735_9ACTN|nr:MBL fold metallo-hydrolase [Streptomyces sulfonofaciens]GHH87340.1 MBL fold hydrolase [Streptomyces sulfonofaciens]
MRIAWQDAGWEGLTARVGRCRLPVWDCTSGLVAGDEGALLVDAGATPAQGGRLRAAAARLLGGGRRVTHLALTHPHFDHVLGAPAFAGAQFHGPAGAGVLLAADTEGLRADAVRHGVAVQDAADAAGALGRLARDTAHAPDAPDAPDAVRRTADPSRPTATAPARPRPPDTRTGARAPGSAPAPAPASPWHPVTDRQALDLGGGVRALLLNVGPGHTAHDLAVLVPGGDGEPDVVFCGDLVEESGEPQAGPDAVPGRWPGALDRLLALGGPEALYVPGHGAVVDAGFVRRQRDQLALRFGVS